jgi:GNAT superfamily N-acetyltransferase
MTLAYSRLTSAGLEIALQLMREFYAGQSMEFLDERARLALRRLAEQPELGGFWFLEVDGRTAGYFAVTVCYSLEFGGRFALLDEFFVRPEFRGAGIGAKALDRVCEEARNLHVLALRLEVDRRNPRLHAFYGRGGFEPPKNDLMTKWLT